MGPVGFLLKRDQPQSVGLCQRLVEVVRSVGETEVVLRDHIELPGWLNAVSENDFPKDLSMLVVLGGDGTMLYGAGLLGKKPVPLLGVNLGRLGFLTCSAPSEAPETLLAAIQGKLRTESRQRLCCRVYRRFSTEGEPAISQEELLVEKTALNDVVVSQPKMARLFDLETVLDGDPVTTYRADGLIVCTPTGSTAYNLAAGGPILMPHMEALVISPICPHTLTARPLVVPLRSVVEIRPGKDAEQALLTVDGQWSHMLGPQDVVQVTCSDEPLTIFRPQEHTFFDLLRTKLHWGVRA
ncbi:MAG TPA: NAD(+)/NADH kinase [Pseudomonadota bacterium]|nr:NAD(+)/NADH kinase [Pseudomonadota bacterium]